MIYRAGIFTRTGLLYVVTVVFLFIGLYVIWENGRTSVHMKQDVEQPESGLPVEPDMTSGWHRTVVLIEKQLPNSQALWIRGGINPSKRKGCTSDDSTSPCSISIKHAIGGAGEHYEAYTTWASGDSKLDWYGAEPGQGWHKGAKADGTPTLWTTNTGTGDEHQIINTFGPHYWMLNVDMNCAETRNGWFELYATTNAGREDHLDLKNGQACWGNAGGLLPHSSTNHLARCGYINVFWFGVSNCRVDKF